MAALGDFFSSSSCRYCNYFRSKHFAYVLEQKALLEKQQQQEKQKLSQFRVQVCPNIAGTSVIIVLKTQLSITDLGIRIPHLIQK